ncbi:MAG: ATP citrate lyase, partial [Nitrospira sp.]
MSILASKDTRVVIQGGQAGVNAARRMAEFCFLNKKNFYVEAFVYPPDAGKTYEIQFGSGLIAVPIYKTVADATKNHP